MADTNKNTNIWKKLGINKNRRIPRATVIASLRIALLSITLLLPLTVLAMNHNAMSGPQKEAELQYDELAAFFREPAPVSMEIISITTKMPSDPSESAVNSTSPASPATPAQQTSSEPAEPTEQPTPVEPKSQQPPTSITSSTVPASAEPPAELPTEPVAEPTAEPTAAPLTPASQPAEPPTEPGGTAENPGVGSTAGSTTEANAPNAQTSGTANEANVQNAYTASGNKIAYITIDDGPSQEVTVGILDVLQNEGIKATFFVLPHGGCRDIYQRIIDEGHEIGNHSYSHNYSKLYSSKNIAAFEDDVLLAQEWMFDNFGYLTTSFRFPGGAMGRKSSIVDPRREFLAEHGYRDFDWHVDTGDANTNLKDKSEDALTQRVLDNTRDREQLIVLMHDTKSKTTTLEALPLIIAGLREQGYTFDIMRNY